METHVNPLLEDKTEMSTDASPIAAVSEEVTATESAKVAYKAGDYICVTLNGNTNAENGQKATESEEMEVSYKPMIITGKPHRLRFLTILF